jgi:hypothetical protein
MAGRPSRLLNPEFCIAVAEAYVSGMGREEMAETLNCHEQTLRFWIRDPRVQAHIVRLTRDRIARITRKIDSEIEARMAHVSGWKVEDLLKVRKEYLSRTHSGDDQASGATSETINELSEAMDADPKLAEALRALVEA